MHQACDPFRFTVKIQLKLSQKSYFFGSFQRFLDHALLHRMSDAPILSQIKGLMEIPNRGKFNQDSVCGCQVMNFQMFS